MKQTTKENKESGVAYVVGQQFSLQRANQIWNHLYRASKKDQSGKYNDALGACESLINRLTELK